MISYIYVDDLVILNIAAHVNLMQVCLWKLQKVSLHTPVFEYLLFAILCICCKLWIQKVYFQKFLVVRYQNFTASGHPAPPYICSFPMYWHVTKCIIFSFSRPLLLRDVYWC
jgi:hypothetical protein